MLSAVVVDDEKLTMELICRLLGDTGRVRVTGFTNPVEAKEYIFSHQPRVVFMDIEMPELSGLHLAERIHESGLQCEIVFLTAHDGYALKAFKVNALDYLLKPVLARELERAMDRVERRCLNMAAPVTKTTKVIVSAFGGFNVRTEGNTEQVKWHIAKCRELAAYFILMGASAGVSKWKLIELLWPDRDADRGDINLRSTICRLNKTWREYGLDMKIVSNRNNYTLEAANITVDALEMQRLALNGKEIESSSLADYEAAFASYKGELFEGYDYSWCAELRVRFQSYYSIVARKLAAYYMERANAPALALYTVEALLRWEPYDEEAQCMALKLHHLTKGRQAADTYFRRLNAMFEEDLGIEPGNAVKIQYEELIRIA